MHARVTQHHQTLTLAGPSHHGRYRHAKTHKHGDLGWYTRGHGQRCLLRGKLAVSEGASARSALVREHYDGYHLQPGLIHGVLSAAAGVDLECKQFICHVDYVLVPEVVGGDV